MSTPAGTARTYGGRSAAERAAERRERLVEATTTVLAERGEPRTTMTAICTEAGLTERYFYESFRSRDEALVAALEAAAADLAARAVEAVGTTSGEPEVRVRAALTAVVDRMIESPARARVLVLEAAGNPALRTRRRALVAWFADVVAEEAEGLLGEAAWPRERARLQATVLVAGVAEVVAGWLLDEVDLSPADLVDLGSELFTSLARRPG